jgi:hypothetical protein
MNPCRFVHRTSFRKWTHQFLACSYLVYFDCPNMTHPSSSSIATLASARSSSSLALFTVQRFLCHPATEMTDSSPPASKRRAHTKSRTGCAECRRRRVKVTFRRPVCPQLPLIALVLQYLHVLKSTLNLTPCLYSAEKRGRAVDIVSAEVSHVCIHLRMPSRFTRLRGARRP